MAISQLPEFETALALGDPGLDGGDLAECHGVACGLICRRGSGGADEYLRLLASLALVEEPAEDLRHMLEALHRATSSQLDDAHMRLALWLPDEADPLEERTQALGRWCTGFLAGLGGGGARLRTLSDEAAEALSDLTQIARAEVGSEGDSEAEEAAFAEIVEYIRVATLLLCEDLRGPAADERRH